MPKHSLKEPGKVDISHDTDSRKNYEEKNIKTEDDDRYPVEPAAIIRQIVKENGYNASAHVDRKPRRREVESDSSPSSLVLGVYALRELFSSVLWLVAAMSRGICARTFCKCRRRIHVTGSQSSMNREMKSRKKFVCFHWPI